MPLFIKTVPDTEQKLAVLSGDSRYDLACSCGTHKDEHRRRSHDNRWIYPAALPGGRTTYLFKTLLSNACVNNCKYCPLRAGADARRCSLAPEELAGMFLSHFRAGKVGGLFLSSAVERSADDTMEKLIRTALLLRKKQFRGYIHLKIIPGASDEAIRQSVALASAVSLNVEAPGAHNFRQLSTTKDYAKDIMRSIKLVSTLTAKGSRYERVKQTTQFVVGAASESDREIIDSCWHLYKGLSLQRIYFSAYQRGLGEATLPGERENESNGALLAREHRLYQVDWLLRRYGFAASEIPLDGNGRLSLTTDPKEAWARIHPECFPVNVNQDDKYRLLRVPGLGETIVSRILAFRKNRSRISSLSNIARMNKVLKKAEAYVTY
jgi:predicted DNA-binding helix-hairpin-helix protein